MGTRGTIGYVLEGVEKFTYNHFDSYPGGLGVDTLAFLREVDIDQLREQVAALQVVDEDTPPSPEQIEQLKKYSNEDVYGSGQGLNDWYVLLRETQGDHKATLESGFLLDGHTFPLDSLFCEWAYIIDLDHEMLEVYKGFQKEPHKEGRFAERGEGRDAYGGTKYYPVKLVAAYPLRELPDDASFEAQVHPPEEEDE